MSATIKQRLDKIRAAVWLAAKAHVPAFKDAHVKTSDGPAAFGSTGGVIDLRVVSMPVESSHSRYDAEAGEHVSWEVYRCTLDVIVRQAEGLDGADLAGQLVNAIQRQDFKEAMLPVKILRLPREIRPLRTIENDRQVTSWSFELPVRFSVEYPTAREVVPTVGSVSVNVNLGDGFVEVVEVEEPEDD